MTLLHCDTVAWTVGEVLRRAKRAELDCFKIAHLEEINGMPYLFSHAGLTLNWINKVNSSLWKLADNKISLADPDIIERINALDDNDKGQEMLSIVGRYRNIIGPKAGSILWADIEEHALPDAPKAYGLNKVFQVVGHSRLNEEYDKIEFENLALIDSEQCFMIDKGIDEKIITLRDYENK